MPKLTEFWTVPQVAERLQVSRHKVLRWIAAGELAATDLSQSRVERPRYRIREAELSRFLNGRQATPSPAKPRADTSKRPAVRQFVG